MAHEAHNIPWDVLASTFQWVDENECQSQATNLHLRFKPDQSEQLNHFVNAMIKNIGEHSDCERKKYPQEYEPLRPDEVFIDEALVMKFSRSVSRPAILEIDPSHGSSEEKEYQPAYVRGPCRHAVDVDCYCRIPYRHRMGSAFLVPYQRNHCYCFAEVNGEAFVNIEIVKLLLLHGKMDHILRICALPNIGLKSWWRMRDCYCGASPPDMGWDIVYRLALDAYICLNLLFCFRETCDLPLEKDYRRTRFYQHMLRQCTFSGMASDIPTEPHRRFFGIVEKQFHESPRLRDQKRWESVPGYSSDWFPYGLISIDELLVSESDIADVGYLPTASDVRHVRWILCDRGLPVELAISVMEAADYRQKRRLNIPHDPLHPENRDQLLSYLEYCWRLMLNCDIMAKSIGMKIPWRHEISSSLVDLIGCQCDEEWKCFTYATDAGSEAGGWIFI